MRSGARCRAALGTADRLFGPLMSKVGDAASSFGRMAGGRFGMAFKLAAGVGLALLIADELRQLGEVRQANVEAAADISESMRRLLADAPSRAEAEQKLAALKAIPENLDGIQGAVYGFADFAKGNILGSAVDGLFGANPAQVNQEQIKALEAYLAQAARGHRGDGRRRRAPRSSATSRPVPPRRRTGPSTRPARRPAPRPPARRWVPATRTASPTASRRTWGPSRPPGTRSARRSPRDPKLESYKQRLGDFRKATETVLRRMRAAGQGERPGGGELLRPAVPGHPQRAGPVPPEREDGLGRRGDHRRRRRRSARAPTSVGWRTASRPAPSGRQQQMQRVARRRAGRAFPAALQMAVGPTSTAAGNVADAAKAPLSTVPPRAATYGDHAGDQFASNLYATAPQTANAAEHIAAQVSRFIAFSHPPRTGPLSTIRSWGPHMVGEWLSPMERHVGDVARMGSRLGAALTPHPGQPAWMDQRQPDRATWAAVGAVGGGGRGGDVHIHVGTLIANDAGLDELERRMERRRHLRRRDRRLVGSPS